MSKSSARKRQENKKCKGKERKEIGDKKFKDCLHDYVGRRFPGRKQLLPGQWLQLLATDGHVEDFLYYYLFSSTFFSFVHLFFRLPDL